MLVSPVQSNANQIHAGALAHLRSLNPATRRSSSVADFAYKAKILSQSEFEEAHSIAQGLGGCADDVLVRSGFLTEEQFAKCRLAQYFIEREVCTEDLAISGLSMACKKIVSLEDGLRYFGWGW